MKSGQGNVLTVNAGSSGIKIALYKMKSIKPLLFAALENIGTDKVNLHVKRKDNSEENIPLKAGTKQQAINFFMDWLEQQESFGQVKAAGHRVVHGMSHSEPEIITPGLLEELKEISAFDPEHMPEEIKLIKQFIERYPLWIQVACFDTAFHTTMPAVAKLLPLPRRYSSAGIRRYGFHGLSYAYLVQELKKLAGKKEVEGRVIFAHLGNGASLAAVKAGKSIDTSMGFTPASGIPMSTRTGDIDPGVAAYLIQHEKLSPGKFNHMINHESGLLGISETSSDMRDLLKNRVNDDRSAEAVALFCYQTKKFIGSYAAALGGLDTLVFSGGIGEHMPEVREEICRDLQFLGIALDKNKNNKNESIISKGAGKVTVRVIPTNEELMIARLVCRVLKNNILKK